REIPAMQARSLSMADHHKRHTLWHHIAAHLRVWPRRVGKLFTETAENWMNDNAPRLSASLAFYSVLSMMPFLIVVATVAGRILGAKAARGQLMWQIQDLVGTAGAKAIQGLMQTNHSTTTTTVLGLLTFALGTSAVVMELRDSLNVIWKLPSKPSSGLRGLLRTAKERAYLFGLILGAGLLLVVSLALNAIGEALSQEFGPFMPMSPLFMQWVLFLSSYAVITLLFASIYKLVPDIKLKWSDVLVGSAVTALFFTLGKHAIGAYLGRAAYGSTYGPAASFVIILLWIYYSAQLFFFGAEFTRVYALRLHPGKEIQERKEIQVGKEMQHG
ncbi:MAG TPA: YihY/virulence factor BrkB family protein, partial [Bryobacteraceae bacterium]|nr:YihY/virulence factor BrkB family protein [Bryobacteraceae bacterium]